MKTNLMNFTKLQISAISQVAWLQLLLILFTPVFFTSGNAGEPYKYITMYTVVIWMLAYLVFRNYAFNDEKYKTRLFFKTLPVTPKTIVGSRMLVVYLFCLVASPLVILSSNLFHAANPDFFIAINAETTLLGLLLASVVIPVECLVFYVFEAQKADIICVAIIAPVFFALALLQHFFKVLTEYNWFLIAALAVLSTLLCFYLAAKLYGNKE